MCSGWGSGQGGEMLQYHGCTLFSLMGHYAIQDWNLWMSLNIWEDSLAWKEVPQKLS